MEEKLPTVLDEINPDNKNQEQPKQESEVLSEVQNEVEQNKEKKELVKTEMCQLIYYDFSLK